MQTNRVDYVDRTLSAPLTRRSLMAAALGVGAVTVSGCSDHGGSPREPVTGSPGSPSGSTTVPSGTPSGPPTREQIIKEFGSRQPEAWGIDVPGVALTLPAGTRAIALTFDCCGGRGGDTLDEALVQTLRDNGTPATFFLSGRWVKSNPEATEQLASDSLFEIANHGTHHQPLSVSGASAYGIPGTHDVGAVYDEVMGAQELIKERTGITPKYFRRGPPTWMMCRGRLSGLSSCLLSISTAMVMRVAPWPHLLSPIGSWALSPEISFSPTQTVPRVARPPASQRLCPPYGSVA